MKKVLIVHHASGVSEAAIQSLIRQIPEVVIDSHEIRISEVEAMPANLVMATPKTMTQRGMELINKRNR